LHRDEVKDEYAVFNKVDINELEITNKGFQFLLQDVNTQVWAFLIQYLNMVDVSHNIQDINIL